MVYTQTEKKFFPQVDSIAFRQLRELPETAWQFRRGGATRRSVSRWLAILERLAVPCRGDSLFCMEFANIWLRFVACQIIKGFLDGDNLNLKNKWCNHSPNNTLLACVV